MGVTWIQTVRIPGILVAIISQVSVCDDLSVLTLRLKIPLDRKYLEPSVVFKIGIEIAFLETTESLIPDPEKNTEKPLILATC